MAHSKVSITRKYYGKVPLDKTGKPIPKNLWPKRRKSSWEVRWYDSEGKRLLKVSKTERRHTTTQEAFRTKSTSVKLINARKSLLENLLWSIKG